MREAMRMRDADAGIDADAGCGMRLTALRTVNLGFFFKLFFLKKIRIFLGGHFSG